MTTKRQISGTQFDITKLVDNAISAADSSSLDFVAARETLTRFYGQPGACEELVTKFARETMVLKILSDETQANFGGQIGKIDFSTREKAISGVQSYLNRRISGQHARWSGRK